jgi:hypothetical protein
MHQHLAKILIRLLAIQAKHRSRALTINRDRSHKSPAKNPLGKPLNFPMTPARARRSLQFIKFQAGRHDSLVGQNAVAGCNAILSELCVIRRPIINKFTRLIATFC